LFRSRVAEDWSVVDNLSQGRVDLAFAMGWNANDFAIAPQNYRDRHPGPDDIYLIVKFSHSTLAIDLGAKRQAYATDEVQDYWVVNLKAQNVTVHRNPANTLYQNVAVYEASDVLSLMAFPDIQIQVSDLL
ncbi:MAG: Uma2 family endonuclease, partial [Cyanobacteria bacterium P01_H01_bin.121]